MSKPELEGHNAAWHRCYQVQYSNSGSWLSEEDCPIRLRGYSELIMGRIAPKLRKKINSSLKRGYRLDNKKDHKTLLGLICKFNPIQRIAIGYIGKSNFHVYVPEGDGRDLQETLNGLAVMTETFKGSDVQRSSTSLIPDYAEVHMKQWKAAGGKGSSDQPQLKACFTHARQVIDGFMEKDAAVREQIAYWFRQDDSVIRIPFDTHQEE